MGRVGGERDKNKDSHHLDGNQAALSPTHTTSFAVFVSFVSLHPHLTPSHGYPKVTTHNRESTNSDVN